MEMFPFPLLIVILDDPLTLAKLSHVIITNEELHTDDQSFGLSTDYQSAASIQPAEISHRPTFLGW